MLLVVMLEGNCQVTQRRFSILFGQLCHVVTLDRLHEALGHAVALRATDLWVTRCKLICRANRQVCSALYAEPLSLSHHLKFIGTSVDVDFA